MLYPSQFTGIDDTQVQNLADWIFGDALTCKGERNVVSRFTGEERFLLVIWHTCDMGIGREQTNVLFWH